MSDTYSSARASRVFVPVRVLTESGWLSGLIGRPPLHRLVDALNMGGDAVMLTNVYVPGGTEDLPFFTCRRDAILLLLPDEPEGAAKAQSGVWTPVTEREVICLSGMATLAGSVFVSENLRVSDYFAKARGFVEMSTTRLTVRDPRSGEQWTRDLPEVLVNTKRIVGVSELHA